jgi:CxxC motif-containing protein (DUF1111 family)
MSVRRVMGLSLAAIPLGVAAVGLGAPLGKAMATTRATTGASPGEPYTDLSPSLLALFDAGKIRFLHEFAPEEGLGPVYNETACQTCHGGPTGIPGGPDALGLGSIHNVKHVGFDNLGYFDPMREIGGPLLGRQSIASDGYPDCAVRGETVPAVATILSVRNTPAVLGLGLIDAIADEEILARQNLGVDGIHGVANWGIEMQAVDDAPNPLIPQVQTFGPPRVGRFGWKGQTATLEQFSAEPLNTELGISGPFFPQEHTDKGLRLVVHLPNACNVAVPKGCPKREFSGAVPIPPDCLATNPDDPEGLQALEIYHFQAMVAPAPTVPGGVLAQWGGSEFARIGCERCHVPEAHTGREYNMHVAGGGSVRVPVLERQTFFPFSDFLLHDMGPVLADGGGATVGRVQGRARGNQWRTTPLWGLRLKASYLHDGRTSDVGAAIEAHGGEGQTVRDRYMALARDAQLAIIDYLLTL